MTEDISQLRADNELLKGQIEAMGNVDKLQWLLDQAQAENIAKARGTAIGLRTYAANAAQGKVPAMSPEKVRQMADEIVQSLPSPVASVDPATPEDHEQEQR